MKSVGFSEGPVGSGSSGTVESEVHMFERRRAAWLGYVVFAIILAASQLARANGQEFFAAPMGKVDLVYTGRVRDINGRFLQRATMVVWSEEVGLTFPSITDDYGHYRSPDVGANIKEV